jgi:glutamate formiminotransferase
VRLVECIPNFSEGRRLDVIESIVAAITSVSGVHLLDSSSDPDHNRTVITFAAAPEVVGEAALRGIRAAAQAIDLNHHSGEHPRIGAADVVPFVPLRGVTLADCVQIARELGRRVGAELGLPVYLYEQAATVPKRANLAHVRRYPYEQLRQRITADPALKPDYGPNRLGPAGAVAIGARGPLIAFNAYLDTAEVEIARQISQTVRASGGGLPGIKALGLLVDGQAQVSMNVVDYRRTSLFTVLEAVRAEAVRHGVRVTRTELVGLVPQAALIDSALAYLGLPAEARELVLEGRLGAATGDYREIEFE